MAQTAHHISPLVAPSSWQDKRQRLLFGDDAPASSLLTEQLLALIDDIVLSRRVRLFHGDRVVACFLIAHRKLLSVEIAGQPVAAGDAASCALQFARALHRLSQLFPKLAPAGDTTGPLPHLDVTPCRLPETAARCCAAHLRSALLHIPGGPQTPSSVFDRALASACMAATGSDLSVVGATRFHVMLEKTLQSLCVAPSNSAERAPAFRASAMPLMQILPVHPDVTLVVRYCPHVGKLWAGVFAHDTLPTPAELLSAQLT